MQVEVAVAKSQRLPEPGARAAGEGERQAVALVGGGQQATQLAVVEDAPVVVALAMALERAEQLAPTPTRLVGWL